MTKICPMWSHCSGWEYLIGGLLGQSLTAVSDEEKKGFKTLALVSSLISPFMCIANDMAQ
jgi:hypothetical protein